MPQPTIEIFAVSNVYTRIMNFKKAGDIEIGHYHTYDHGTLISSGSIKLEILGENLETIETKIYKAPRMVLIKKEFKHRLTALEDNTVAVCIHALRDVEGELLPVETIEEVIHTTPDEDRKALIEHRNSNSVKEYLNKKNIVLENMVDNKS
jgi:hypothetical protein